MPHYLKDSVGTTYSLPASLEPTLKRPRRTLAMRRGDTQPDQWAAGDGGPEPGLFELTGVVKRATGAEVESVLNAIKAAIATAVLLGLNDTSETWERAIDTAGSLRGYAFATPLDGSPERVALTVRIPVGAGGATVARPADSVIPAIVAPGISVPPASPGGGPVAFTPPAAVDLGTWYKSSGAFSPIYAPDSSYLPPAPNLSARTGWTIGLDNLIYASDGDLTVMNPTVGTWSALAPIPTDVLRPVVIATGGKIYVIGGDTGASVYTNKLQIYDVATNAWSAGALMPDDRAYAAGALLDGIIYVTGGITDAATSTELATVYTYTIATNAWATASSMIVARAEHNAGIVGGRLVVAGGFNDASADKPVATARVRASSGSWADLPNLPYIVADAYAAVPDGSLYLLGGHDFNFFGRSSSVRLNASTMQWEAVREAPELLINDYGNVAVAFGLIYCFTPNGYTFAFRPPGTSFPAGLASIP